MNAHPLALKRLAFLDAARAISALLVFFQHDIDSLSPILAEQTRNGIGVGQIGVTCFFLISGFVIPYSLEQHGTIARFAIARFFRLFPLYWTVITLLFLLTLAGLPTLPPSFAQELSWKSYFIHLTMLQGYLPMTDFLHLTWTLVTEIQFYILAAFLYWMNWKSLPRIIYSACAIVLLVAITAYVLHKRLPIYPVALILTSLAGQSVAAAWAGRISPRACALAVLTIWSTSMLAIYLRILTSPYPVTIRGIMITWILAYALFFAFFYVRHLPLSLLAYLGRISYSIYLIHPLIIWTLLAFLPPSWWTLPLALTLVIASSALTYHFIERPGIRFAKWLNQNRT